MTTQDRLPSETERGESTSDLDVDLARLFVRERRAHPNSAAQKERVRTRLERSLNLGPGDRGGGGGAVATSASSSRSTSTVKRLVGALSISASVFVGASLLWTFASEGSRAKIVVRPEPLASPAKSTNASSQASSDAPGGTTAEVAAFPVEALPSVRVPVGAVEHANAGRRTERAVSCTICEERAILEVGRRGLREKNGGLALGAIDEHESRFPTGQLAEERASLRVHVLFALGRVEEAEARKSDFLRRYPRSPLLESVKRAGIR